MNFCVHLYNSLNYNLHVSNEFALQTLKNRRREVEREIEEILLKLLQTATKGV